ncbi:MAG: PKD domain-containing protein, partial [Lentimicrobiaceae bacterium]|nr:PKD domain-containing protein [Lentimicrobiaceae bacterium]
IGGYQYAIDGGTFQTGTTFDNVADGSHTLTVKNTTTGCTTTSSSFNTNCTCDVPPTLTLATNDTTVCGANVIVIAGNSFGGSATAIASITASGTAGGSVTQSTSGNNFTITYTPDPSDLGKTITLLVKTNNPDGAPCTAAEQTLEITINPLPVISLTANPTTACTGEDITLATETGMSKYVWDFGGGTKVDSTGATVILSWDTDGEKTVTVNYTNNNGCSATAPKSIKVTITERWTSSDITTTDKTICPRTSTTLTASSSTVTNPTFYWYKSQNSTTILNIGETYDTGILTSDTAFYVSVSGSSYCENATGDRKKVSVAIISVPAPSVAITVLPSTIVCVGTSVTFSSTITNEGINTTYQWTLNGAPILGATNDEYTYIPEYGDIIRCTITTVPAVCTTPFSITSNGIIMRVIGYPEAPKLIIDTLNAFIGMPIDLSLAVDIISGISYNYYQNPDGTGNITGSVVIFEPPKYDYYVAARNDDCEGPISQIMLRDECPKSVKDEEGNVYKVASLAGLCWTENLKTTIYPDTKDKIPFAKPYTCYGCPSQLDTTFGLLYTWYSAMKIEAPVKSSKATVQGICPKGYHIPSKEEWNILNTFTTEQLKGTLFWIDPLGPGINELEFNALPAGWYNSRTDRFEDLYGFAGWWACDFDLSHINPYQNAGGYDFEDEASLNLLQISPFLFSIQYHCDNILHATKNCFDALSVRCVMNK